MGLTILEEGGCMDCAGLDGLREVGREVWLSQGATSSREAEVGGGAIEGDTSHWLDECCELDGEVVKEGGAFDEDAYEGAVEMGELMGDLAV